MDIKAIRMDLSNEKIYALGFDQAWGKPIEDAWDYGTFYLKDYPDEKTVADMYSGIAQEIAEQYSGDSDVYDIEAGTESVYWTTRDSDDEELEYTSTIELHVIVDGDTYYIPCSDDDIHNATVQAEDDRRGTL